MLKEQSLALSLRHICFTSLLSVATPYNAGLTLCTGGDFIRRNRLSNLGTVQDLPVSRPP